MITWRPPGYHAFGIYLASVSTFSGGIANSGTILGELAGSDANGIDVRLSTFSGGITNSGLIQAFTEHVAGDFAAGIDV